MPDWRWIRGLPPAATVVPAAVEKAGPVVTFRAAVVDPALVAAVASRSGRD